MSAESRRGPLRALGRWIGIGLLALGLVWLLRELDPERLAAALSGADWRLILAAALLNLSANMVVRALRWRSLLGPLPRPGTGPEPRLRELLALLFRSHAWSNLLPARAGEAVRVMALHRGHGYPVGDLVAVQVFEKVVEVLSLLLLALGLLLAGSRAPALTGVLGPLLGLGGAGLVAVLVLAWRGRGRPGSDEEPATGPAPAPRGLRARARVAAGHFLRRLGRTMQALRSPGIWLRSLGWSLASDAIDLGLIGLCLAAVGIPAGPDAWVLLLLAVNLAIVLPSTPGQVGVLEGAAVLVLVGLGVGREQALAFALLYHAVHALPVTAIGLVTHHRARRATS